MSPKLSAGPTDLCGRKEFLLLQESMMCRKNWIGIFGWAHQRKLNSILLIFLSTGAAGGILVQAHWETWRVTSWILCLEFYRLIIPRKWNAAQAPSGMACS